jgi:hypothetical protein
MMTCIFLFSTCSEIDPGVQLGGGGRMIGPERE